MKIHSSFSILYVTYNDKALSEFLNKNGAESLSKVVQEFLQAKNNLLDKAE